MGFRFRKSIKIFPGVRINLSKSGIGASVGVKGYRVTRRADGKVQKTVSVPGTGISYVTIDNPEAQETSPVARPAKSPQSAKCPKCQARYRIGKVRYCSQCGFALSV